MYSYTFDILLARAVQSGYTVSRIAEICDVDVKTIQRYKKQGYGDAERTKLLQQELGPLLFTEEELAILIIKLYKKSNLRFKITDKVLKTLSGPERKYLSPVYMMRLKEILAERGFILWTVEADACIWHVVWYEQTLLNKTNSVYNQQNLAEYIQDIEVDGWKEFDD